MIIGLTGKKQSGKSTVATHLARVHGFERVNFKDALCEEVLERFPTVLELLADSCNMTIPQLFTEKPPFMRVLLQNYGTEVRRGDDPDYWTRKWKERALDHVQPAQIVVDDVRFQNEAEAVRDLGGIIVRITRRTVDLTEPDYHQSETEMDSIEADYTIEARDGELYNLYHAIDELV